MIIGINNTTTFCGRFLPVSKLSLNSQIRSKLPVGEVTSVFKDSKGILVKQTDGRAKIVSRFVDDKLRESTEFIDGNKYKAIYSDSGKLVKKIQKEAGQKRVISYKDGLPTPTMDLFA